MAKKVSKFFRIGVEGDTCDGRIISASDIQEMAETYDPRVYGCRINLEHLRGLLPDDLIAMNKAAQKVYTSMEIQPNFANTGKCYLVGLAVTDDPASLGTEYLEFCRNAKHNPLQRFKANPENVFSAATLAELEFEDVPDTVLNSLADKVKAIFSRKQVSDDARLNDVHEAVTTVSEHVQTNLTKQDERLSAMETAFATFKQELTGKVEETSQAFSALKTTLDKTESFSQPRRTKASGGGGDELLTDC